MRTNWSRILMAGALAGWLAACAPLTPPLEDEAVSQTPAVLALADSAAGSQEQGEYESAAAALERALRLEPRNALLWHRLARVRLAQERWAEAESLAMRSLSLEDDSRLHKANWELIEEARRRAGNLTGARDARAILRNL